MTPTFRWHHAVPVACALMTASCAGLPPPSAPVPPQLILPDLEVAYMARGGDLVACDAARQLAVDTLLAERALQVRWRRTVERRR